AVFNTGVVGYMDTLTDPRYYGQMVLQTFPQIGNYGELLPETLGRKPVLSGYIVKEVCESPSNWRMEGRLQSYLEKNEIVGICDIDTRKLTHILREKGSMNVMIAPNKNKLEEKLKEIKAYKISDAVKNTSISEAVVSMPENAQATAVLWDFGHCEEIQQLLLDADFVVDRVPYNTKYEDIVSYAPDVVILSDGAGQPKYLNKELDAILETVKKLTAQKTPMVGLGFGHLLLAQSKGAKIVKMKNAHRGQNQPVKDLATGKVVISIQNHGDTVDCRSLIGLPCTLSEVNVNDKDCEGIDYKDAPAFSIAYNPTKATITKIQQLIKGDK
ncbi:MAG: carbamoyl phosphate synthase small subunit, partial [Firmicutes bacterium]|nr:carbamoyl phosphate synthase small subunit [Bacillota bacterium]